MSFHLSIRTSIEFHPNINLLYHGILLKKAHYQSFLLTDNGLMVKFKYLIHIKALFAIWCTFGVLSYFQPP